MQQSSIKLSKQYGFLTKIIDAQKENDKRLINT